MRHVVAVIVLVLSGACLKVPNAPTLEVFGRDGPTAPLVAALVTAYACTHPANPVHMSTFAQTDSDAAVAQRVSTGSGVMGFLGRHLKDVERSLAQEEPVNPVAGGVAIVRSVRTTLLGVATADLPSVFAGKFPGITSVVTTPRGTLARDPVERVVSTTGRGDAVREAPTVVAALDAAERDPSVAAVVPYASVALPDGLRFLTVDGVAPEPQSISNGSYAFRIWFALLLPHGDPSPAAATFLAFARSDQGTAAILSAYTDSPHTGTCSR